MKYLAWIRDTETQTETPKRLILVLDRFQDNIRAVLCSWLNRLHIRQNEVLSLNPGHRDTDRDTEMDYLRELLRFSAESHFLVPPAPFEIERPQARLLGNKQGFTRPLGIPTHPSLWSLQGFSEVLMSFEDYRKTCSTEWRPTEDLREKDFQPLLDRTMQLAFTAAFQSLLSSL